MNTIGFSEISDLATHLWRQSYRGNRDDKVGRYIASKVTPDEFWDLVLIEDEVYASAKQEME